MFNKFSIGLFVITLLYACNNNVNIKHKPKVETLIDKLPDTLKTERDTCICSEKNQSTFNISCDTIKLKNGSMLYSLFNSDSSWFEYRNSKKNIKRILYSLPKELIELTNRMGYSLYSDLGNYFFLENETSSGSDPYIEYLLFNSNTGKMIKNFHSVLFISEKYPIVIKLANMNDTNYNDYHFSKIEIINYKKNKSYFIEIPAKELQKKYDIEYNEYYYAEYFFNTKEINNYTLKISFDLPTKIKPITINLREYIN